MPASNRRVCVIGAGPSGMSTLFQFGQMKSEEVPDIVCYEKQSTWGGLWNYTWRTDVDEFGEPCHGVMYRHLWSNNPKEVTELPDYTYEEHFGRVLPSFVPGPIYREYLEGRWTKKSTTDLKQLIRFNHAVRHVQYNEATDDFTVTVHDLCADTVLSETFSHVIVAVGIFHVPNVPELPGLNKFEGRVIHSHAFRNAQEFKGQRLLVIGASYSADDIAMQCLKFGAKSVVCTWRSKPMGLQWPEGIEERPLVQKLDGNTAHFRDESTADVDAIIICTGYQYSFPFMAEDLRLTSNLTLYPGNLYKGCVWVKGGNNKLFYIGVQNQLYTFTMFDVHALWICRYIMGRLDNEPKTTNEMARDIAEWEKRCECTSNSFEAADFQTAFVSDLCDRTGYERGILKSHALLHAWLQSRQDDIKTFRDRNYASNFTRNKSTHISTWLTAMDDSVDFYH